MAANALFKSHSPLGDYFRRMRAKLGAPSAITAAAHKLARIVHHMLSTREAYDPTSLLGDEKRFRARSEARLHAQAKTLGYIIVPAYRPRQHIKQPRKSLTLPDNCSLGEPGPGTRL